MKPHYVYRLYDESGVLLYVGRSQDVHHRIYMHLSLCNLGKRVTDGLWLRLAAVTIWRYPDRDSASRAEAKAIREEGPWLNIHHNLKPGPPLSLTPDDLPVDFMERVEEIERRRDRSYAVMHSAHYDDYVPGKYADTA